MDLQETGNLYKQVGELLLKLSDLGTSLETDNHEASEEVQTEAIGLFLDNGIYINESNAAYFIQLAEELLVKYEDVSLIKGDIVDLKKTSGLHRRVADLLMELDAYIKEAEEPCNFGAMYDREQVAETLYNILGLEDSSLEEFIGNTESLLQQFRQRQNEATVGV